jgi:transketolase
LIHPVALPVAAIRDKADWVRRETLRLYRRCQATRVSSSLSCVEILSVLYYGGFLRYDPRDPLRDDRDRLVISKAHGSTSFYPILADLGFIDRSELEKIGKTGGLLKAIPDPFVPGYETMNGSVGQGLGVACGMAMGLRLRGKDEKVFVLSGDGELHEGSVWEGAMFAAHHRLDNIVLIVDDNGRCMLDYSRNVLSLEPLDRIFQAFGWEARTVDGHDIGALDRAYREVLSSRSGHPHVIVAKTVKGKGVPSLEHDPLAHIRVVNAEEIDRILGENP